MNNRERPLGISRLEQQGEHFHAAITPVESGKTVRTRGDRARNGSAGYTEAVFLTDEKEFPQLIVAVRGEIQ